MNFELSEEQQMLKRTARDFLTNECPVSLVRDIAKDDRGHPLELWNKMASLGWMGLAFPTEYGGEGGSFLDLAVLLEEFGRARLTGPFFTTVVSGLTLVKVASEKLKREILPQISEGRHICTLAILEPGVENDLSFISTGAVVVDGGYLINGTKLFVPYAHVADSMICAARVEDKGISLFLVPADNPGIKCSLLETISGEKLCEVVFDAAIVPVGLVMGELGQAERYLSAVMQKAAVGYCLHMVGAMQRALEMTVAYAKERIQFQRPLGSFQAVQHHCANMAVDIDASRFISYEAAWKLSQGLDAKLETSMAKAWVSEAFVRVIALAHQVNGGVGIMDDHDLTLYTKQGPGWTASFGNADFHWEQVARELGL